MPSTTPYFPSADDKTALKKLDGAARIAIAGVAQHMADIDLGGEKVTHGRIRRWLYWAFHPNEPEAARTTGSWFALLSKGDRGLMSKVSLAEVPIVSSEGNHNEFECPSASVQDHDDVVITCRLSPIVVRLVVQDGHRRMEHRSTICWQSDTSRRLHKLLTTTSKRVSDTLHTGARIDAVDSLKIAGSTASVNVSCSPPFSPRTPLHTNRRTQGGEWLSVRVNMTVPIGTDTFFVSYEKTGTVHQSGLNMSDLPWVTIPTCRDPAAAAFWLVSSYTFKKTYWQADVNPFTSQRKMRFPDVSDASFPAAAQACKRALNFWAVSLGLSLKEAAILFAPLPTQAGCGYFKLFGELMLAHAAKSLPRKGLQTFVREKITECMVSDAEYEEMKKTQVFERREGPWSEDDDDSLAQARDLMASFCQVTSHEVVKLVTEGNAYVKHWPKTMDINGHDGVLRVASNQPDPRVHALTGLFALLSRRIGVFDVMAGGANSGRSAAETNRFKDIKKMVLSNINDPEVTSSSRIRLWPLEENRERGRRALNDIALQRQTPLSQFNIGQDDWEKWLDVFSVGNNFDGPEKRARIWAINKIVEALPDLRLRASSHPVRNVILSLIETLHVEAQRNELGINNFAHDVVSEREIVTIALVIWAAGVQPHGEVTKVKYPVGVIQSIQKKLDHTRSYGTVQQMLNDKWEAIHDAYEAIVELASSVSAREFLGDDASETLVELGIDLGLLQDD